ncbi:MAG: DUF2085 domain-containing protein [Actinobacteria bacterium]|nr:DUF2085 domain-containing protein [Actinomycetota bacterium]
MESALYKFINIIGASVCHQLPERSFFAGMLKIPLCARCEGIYIGFFITALILFIMFRKKESDLPPVYVIALIAFFIISTVVDGVFSYFFAIGTNNISRFVTGYLAGAAAMTVIYPVFNYQYYSEPAAVRIYNKPWQFIIFLSISCGIIFIGILNIVFVNYFFVYFSALAVIFTFYFVNIILVLLIPHFSHKSSKLFSKHLIIPTIIALMLATLELFVSYKFHMYMLRISQ